MSAVQVAYGFRPLSSNNNNNVVVPRAVSASSPSVSPVRRRLFADDDEEDGAHRLSVMVLEQQLALIQREQSAKYNFDFHAEVPLAGRYVWERPSHPLPPPVASKRPLDVDDDNDEVAAPPSAKRTQTKITGKNTWFSVWRRKSVSVCLVMLPPR